MVQLKVDDILNSTPRGRVVGISERFLELVVAAPSVSVLEVMHQHGYKSTSVNVDIGGRLYGMFFEKID